MGAGVRDLRFRRRASGRSRLIRSISATGARAPAAAGRAGDRQADRILKRIQRLSAKYGTRIERQDEIGLVPSLGRMATLSRHRSRSTSARNVAQTAPEAVVVGIQFSTEGQGFMRWQKLRMWLPHSEARSGVLSTARACPGSFSSPPYCGIFVGALHPQERLNVDHVPRSKAAQVRADRLCKGEEAGVGLPGGPGLIWQS